MTKIFIDGKAGTTGLRIYERLEKREDITLLTLSDEDRKNPDARKKMLNSCNVAFLCLPDDAAREAVAMVENEDVVIIDASTAHRTNPDWAYGFPELSPEFENKIKSCKRIAVPGCHASGFIALIYPLIKEKIISPSALLTCTSVTGYSGGGKKMIEGYENENRDILLSSPRQYGLSQNHKHLPEMKAITGIEIAPIFSPIVADFYSGMAVTVPLFNQMLLGGKTIDDVINVYKKYYHGELVKFVGNADEGGFFAGNKLSGKDNMEISVFGSGDRILLAARYDNLGKGASGAAVECLNIVLNKQKTLGLVL